MDFSFFTLRNTEGEPIAFMAFGNDLRIRSASMELLETIQHNLEIGGWQFDVKTGLTIWSEKVYEIHKVPYGRPVEKIEAINFYLPHERERVAKCVEECSVDGRPFDEEFEFQDSEGKHLWVRSTGEPVHNANGEIYKLKGTFQDITERKKIENKRKFSLIISPDQCIQKGLMENICLLIKLIKKR